MEKIKKRIANLKVAGKLKVYRMTVLVMTLFLVLVALISTLVIRSNIEKITEVWSPSLEYLQDLETMMLKRDKLIMKQQAKHKKDRTITK